ncbi:unnamed protein product [Heterobilharzia americana]|nr:unnamed protein product [Heterobilharzia americana]
MILLTVILQIQFEEVVNHNELDFNSFVQQSSSTICTWNLEEIDLCHLVKKSTTPLLNYNFPSSNCLDDDSGWMNSSTVGMEYN